MEAQCQQWWEGLEAASQLYKKNPNDDSAKGFFLQYKQMENIILVSQYILQRTQTQFVKWHCLRAISEAIVQRWDTLSLQDIMQALEFTVAFIHSQGPKLTNEAETVISQAMLIIAVACKRGWLDPSQLKDTQSSLQLKAALHQTVISFLQNEKAVVKLFGMKLMLTLIEEFSAQSKTTTKINMPWEYHVEVFNTFEQTALLEFFQMAFGTLNTIMQRPDMMLLDADIKRLFKETLKVLQKALDWPFGNGSQAILGFGFSKRAAWSVQLSPAWRAVIVESSDVIEMFFKVFKLVKSERDANQSNVMSILMSLASVSEDSFTQGMGHRVQYLGFFSSQLRPLMAAAITGEEFYVISQIAEVLLRAIPVGAFHAAFAQEFQALCETFFEFSVRVLQLYSRDVEDSTKATESFEMILDSWVSLVQTDECPQYGVEGAVKFFDVYVTARVARAIEELREDEERVDENGYDIVDRIYFADELESIAKLGRCASLNAITQVGQKVANCMNLIQQWSANAEIPRSIEEVWEELHWLILIAGFLLTDDAKGETPSLAPELVMPNPALEQHLAQGGSDPLVALSEAMFTLVQWLNNEIQRHANQVQELKMAAANAGQSQVNIPSPSWSALIAEDLMWYTSRWCKYYLLIPPTASTDMCPVRNSILARFGQNTQSAMEIFNFVVQTSWLNMSLWSGEPEAQYQACEILSSIACRRFPPAAFKSCQAFSFIYQTHTRDGSVLFSMGADIQRKFMKSMCQMEIGDSETERIQYIQDILQPVENKWASVVQDIERSPDKVTSKILKDSEKLLERCRGIVQSCSSTTWRPIYSFVKRMFRVWLACLRHFYIYKDVVLLTLKLITDASTKLLDWISDDEDVSAYLGELMNYFKVFDDLKLGKVPKSKGRRSKREILEEENEKERELAECLSVIEVVSGMPQLKAAEASSFGLYMVLSSVTPSMLEYRQIRDCYFNIASNIFLRHTARLHLLDDNLFLLLLNSFEYALSQGSEKPERAALESVQKVAEYLFHPPADAQPFSPAKRAGINKFVGVILSYLLFEDGFNYEMVDLASGAFLAIICCEQETYMQTVNTLIAQQHPSIHPRLSQYFSALMQDIELSISKENQRKFREKMRGFLSAARGILGRK